MYYLSLFHISIIRSNFKFKYKVYIYWAKLTHHFYSFASKILVCKKKETDVGYSFLKFKSFFYVQFLLLLSQKRLKTVSIPIDIVDRFLDSLTQNTSICIPYMCISICFPWLNSRANEEEERLEIAILKVRI